MNLTSLAYENGMTLGEALNVSITGIVVVMIILATLAVLVLLLSRAIQLFVKKKPVASTEPQKDLNTVQDDKPKNVLPENESAGNLDLFDTDEKTAATIMAIISHESGIPLNKLKFNSIKLLKTDNQ